MDNTQGISESPLLIFGGAAPETDPASLPAGSAAICTDCDFTVTSVRTRDGLANVYVYEGADELDNAGLGIDVAVPGGVAWTNPDNIIHDTPGTYASVALNGAVVTPGILTFESSVSAIASPAPVTISGSKLNSYCIFIDAALVGSPIPPNDAGWASIVNVNGFNVSGRAVNGPVTATTSTMGYTDWAALLLFFSGGLTPTPVQNTPLASFSGPTHLVVFPSDQTAGNINVAIIQGVFNDPSPTPTVTDSNGNVYTLIASVQNGAAPCSYIQAFSTGPVLAGPNNVTFHITSGAFNCNWATVIEMPSATFGPNVGFTDILRANTYGFTIPSMTSILGVELQVKGKQSQTTTELTVTPIGGGDSMTFSVPASDGTTIVGGPGEFFGLTLTPAIVNNPGFGFDVTALDSSGVPGVTVDLSAVKVKIWYTPPGVGNFNFVGSFGMQNETDLTLALDDSGVFWQENIATTPGVLTPFYTTIEPNTFADMSVQDDRAFIALSDLQHGTDMPRGYNGQWVDRLSQVGPGIAPSFSATATTYTISTITQPAAVTNAAPNTPIHTLIWSSAAGTKHSAGNVLTVEYTPSPANPPDPNLVVGGGVVLSGFQTAPYHGGDPNGSYIIASVQVVDTGSGLRNSFSVINPQSTLGSPGSAITGSSYQASLATITLTTPAPGVQVGTQILVAGATPAAWNNTWTILSALNAAQLQITATSLTSGVATYDFTLISGTAPTSGQQVTVTGTTNGGGIFNLANATIASASPTSFTIAIDSPDVTASAEPTGQAIVNGTIFTFDPGPTFLGPTPSTPTSPFIIGNDSSGGTIVQPGALGSGTRQGTVLFLTRNGFLTAPAPPATFTLNAGANAIIATNIPLGPPNVIARVIALTGANGAFFFWIPTPVTVTDNGQLVTYDATIINDNVTTQATFFITDAVLLAALSIDTDGSNNFREVELGSSIGVISYSQRLFAWGEQNKVQNFLNLSFDGGYLANNTQSPLVPAGWTVDLVSGNGGTLSVSPLFGNGYYIQNTTGMTQTTFGMIEQTASQDYLKVAILNPQTEYGVRITASSPSGAASGNLVVDLFSPSFGASFGSASIPLASLTATMHIFTLDLLTTAFTTQVPADLLLRLYAQNIPNNGDALIDRLEVYDLAQPVLSTQLRGSYFNNFEAFDGVTGNLGVAAENQQPVRNAFELFDNLYIIKTKSFVSTSDNGTTEPNFWQVREVSNKVGTPSIYGVDVGEGWALIAGEAGVYIFAGGDPIKISPEIDPLWRTINWTYGYTLWIRNDTINRKLFIGVPIPTPNQWMPSFEENLNPTQPNVVLVCNYKELMTSSAISSEGPLRVAYTGELKSFPLGRKWSAWSIEACYADFITRPDTTARVFFCGDAFTAKIYQQIAGNYADDGEAMHCQYISYGFPKSSEAQQSGMGLHELLAHFMSMTIVGDGNLRMTIYPDSIESPDQEALYPEPLLNPPPYGDAEVPLNIRGNRFFVGLSVSDAGEWFDISKMILSIGPDPFSPVRGSNG